MLTTTEGTTKGRNLFGNILGLPIRYHNYFPRHRHFIWGRHPSDRRLKGSAMGPKDTVARTKVGSRDQSGLRAGFVSSLRLLNKKRPPTPAHGSR